MSWSKTILLALAAVMVCSTGLIRAEDGIVANIGTKTLGGPANWTDLVIHGDWRIQQHQTFGHHRLLDPHERRKAVGTLDECFRELERRRCSGEIPPMPSSIVIMIHGLSGSRGIMEGTGRHLKQSGGLYVINFGYASTSGSIQKLTVSLESVIRNLEGVQEVSFVAHSLGNLLVRHLFYRFSVQENPPPVRFKRLVMISPPNHGAEIADTVGQLKLFQLALGEIVNQFAPEKGFPELERQLAIPPIEFGILAGGRGNETGFLPSVPGDDDGLLSLQTHMLNGSSDFLQTGGLHQLMPRYKSVREQTLAFLQTGRFFR